VIVCDTGPLVAALNAADKYHEACRELLLDVPGPLIVPAPVLTEVCYLTARTRAARRGQVPGLASRSTNGA
jgi:predicted nucleic acid-binding protein